jgi:hypothetical protein
MTAANAVRKLKATALSFLALLLIGPGQPRATSASLAIYGISLNLNPGLTSDIHKFNQFGLLEQTWSAAETRAATTAASIGSSLFLGEGSGAIERYDLNGVYRGTFANVSSLAGPMSVLHSLESDSANKLYAVFGGSTAGPGKSFRLGPNGRIEAQYSHVDLIFPSGIDATANGDVYIATGTARGLGPRLFRFSADGAYLADFAIQQVEHPAQFAINETTNELYIADQFGDAIVVYDLSSDSPSHIDTLEMPSTPLDVFIEPTTGRIFGSGFYRLTDVMGNFAANTGFEITRDGKLKTDFVENGRAREQTILSQHTATTRHRRPRPDFAGRSAWRAPVVAWHRRRFVPTGVALAPAEEDV